MYDIQLSENPASSLNEPSAKTQGFALQPNAGVAPIGRRFISIRFFPTITPLWTLGRRFYGL